MGKPPEWPEPAEIVARLGRLAGDAAAGATALPASLFGRTLLWGLAFVAVALVADRLPRRPRQWLVGLASVALIDVFTSRVVCGLYLVYAAVFFAVCHHCPWRRVRAALLVGLLGLLVVWPVLIVVHPMVWLEVPQRQFVAFASNVALLRFWAYAWRQAGASPGDAGGFLLAMSFFPTFMNGPIETYDDQRAAGDARTAAEPGTAAARLGAVLPGALVRIGWGAVKYLVSATWFGSRTLAIFMSEGAAVDLARLWLWVPELYFQFYLGFSGWADLSIGLGRLAGANVRENFARPWAGRNVADFWNRWHISFGVWLRDFVYIPLGGKYRHRALNIVAVFVVSALWHVWGALKLFGPTLYPPRWWTGFLAWGLLNAVGVIVAHALPGGLRLPLRLAQATTFLFVAVAWIPFFLPPPAPIGSWLVIIGRLLGLG